MPAPGAPLDSLGVRAERLGLAERLERAARGAAGVAAGLRDPAVVVVSGAGSGATAASLLVELGGALAPVPVVFGADARLARFVAATSLLVVLDATGSRAESAALVREGHRRGADVLVVSGPGPLAELAGSLEVATVLIEPVAEHRGALVSLLAPVVVALGDLGLLDGSESMLAAAVDQLRVRLGEALAATLGEARELARVVGRTFPFVVSGEGLGALAANWWKAEINERAKTPAFCATLPEAAIADVAAFGQAGDVTRQLLTLLTLSTSSDPAAGRARLVGFAEAVRETVATTVSLRAGGEGPLAEALDLVVRGSLFALELAAREGLDPGPVPAATDLEALASPAGGQNAP